MKLENGTLKDHRPDNEWDLEVLCEQMFDMEIGAVHIDR